MTEASREAFKRARKRVRVVDVVDYMKTARQSTVHDAVHLLAQRFGADESDVQESGQFWAEVVSRFGDAARAGFLSDSAKVPGPKGVSRTLYEFLDVPREKRLSGPDQLRARIKELEGLLSEMRVKYEVACSTIDRLEGKGV